PVPCYQLVAVQAGQMLKLGPIRQGCRGYLALKGGLHVDHIMQSASTYLRADQTERLTQGVTIGTVQVPHDGHPIILMADSQPTGGYPVMGQVISIDIPRLAQMKPGDKLRFEPIELADAQSLLRTQEQYLQRLSIAAAYKWKDILHA
ncbi:KipI antagonist, partial [Elysia marginata]